MISPPRAIIFDWDNTLVDTWPVITEALNAARSAFGLETWGVEMARLTCSAKSARDQFPDWFGENTEKATAIFFGRYREVHLDRLKPLVGAESLLRCVQEIKMPSMLVSNKRGDILRAEVQKLGWTDFFVTMVGAMDTAHDKPHRAPVDLALNQAGLKADDPSIWLVGDSGADVECARNSGCTSVILAHEGEAKRLGAELSFSDCHALQSLLYNNSLEQGELQT